MLFSAKLVEDRPAGKMMIGIAATGVVFIFIGLLLPSLQSIVPFFIIVLFLSILVMAIVFKGDLSNYQLVNDLNVYIDGMQISRLVFPFVDVTELAFEFQSYHEKETYHNRGRRGQHSYGLGNRLSFIYRNQTFRYQFYLQSPRHYTAFVKMLELLYEHHISFTEKNLKGRTFMMQNVNEDQLRLLKRQYKMG